MADVSESIEIACSAEAAFAYLDDLTRQTEWQGTLERVTVEGGNPTRVGTRVHEVRRVPGGTHGLTYEIVEHTPGRGFAFRGGGGPIRVSARVSVDPLGENRCRVTAAFSFSAGLKGKVLLPLIRHEAAKAVPEDQRRLKALLEAG